MIKRENRRLPWQGLESSFTSRFTKTGSALEAACLDWQVHLEPVYLEEDRWRHLKTLKNDRWRELDTDALGTRVTRHRAVVRSDNGYPLGIVGRRYVPIQNSEMLSLAEEFQPRMVRRIQEEHSVKKAEFLAATKPEIIAAGESGKGRRVFVVLELRVPSVTLDSSKKGRMRFFVVMTSSHDGSAAFRVGLVPIRLACSNQLRLWMLHRPPISWHIRHTKSAGLSIEDLEKAVDQIPGYLEHLIDLRKAMSEEEISDEEFDSFLEKLIPLPEDEKKKRAKSIRERNRGGIREAYKDEAKNRWGVINAVAAWEQWAKVPKNVTDADQAMRLLTLLVAERGVEYVNRALVLLAPRKDGSWPALGRI